MFQLDQTEENEGNLHKSVRTFVSLVPQVSLKIIPPRTTLQEHFFWHFAAKT